MVKPPSRYGVLTTTQTTRKPRSLLRTPGSFLSLRHDGLRDRLRSTRPQLGSAGGLNCGHAEAEEAVPVARVVPAAVRRPAVPAVAEPAAAANDPARGRRGD